MSDPTDKDIRAAAGAIITAAIVDPMVAAQVYDWNALSHKLDEWPGLFGEPRHGWIIKTSADTSTRKNIVKDRKAFTLDVWGFYGFRSGKTGDNSDDEFSVIRAAVYGGFKASPNLGLEGIEIDLLQFPKGSITTIDCGEETLHFAGGELTGRICC